MIAIPQIRRVLSTAQRHFGSPANTELAKLIILALLGLIVSLLIILPGDQTADSMHNFVDWFARRS